MFFQLCVLSTLCLDFGTFLCAHFHFLHVFFILALFSNVQDLAWDEAFSDDDEVEAAPPAESTVTATPAAAEKKEQPGDLS